MKNCIEKFKLFLQQKSSSLVKTIVFPEGNNIKIIESASICSQLNISRCILLGDKKYIHEVALKKKIIIDENVTIINPDSIRNCYAQNLFNMRKEKDIKSYQDSLNLLDNNIVLSLMMLNQNDVDGVVAGIENTTADIIRPTFKLIQNNCINSFVSSIFLMLFPDKVLIYGDCAINQYPDSNALAQIAIQSAKTANSLGISPKIAMLSYATGNSSLGSSVYKIREAIDIVKNVKPNLLIDGPMQYDAAVSSAIARIKLPNSQVAGHATVLIFPDLNSGNITYKAVQRSSGIISIGPVLQGLQKPVNDLSRGASIDDIVYTTAMTVIQSF
ncbi:Phosphate acetyltransferase [Buchnera aphidicola (Cinara kochiana kochiana)]|uniref:Phosphate acetyltransferase n=1 Tax=Buchnera aphidicola (Cinara kochiana kochiana) TaxID=2518976 RepID=A0A451D5A8_9GAMM|nr:phosphate acetyltransferase [Buchnera aphidicola]VFP81040.1 Phosphate acetyltransferase [Buchnera aphidicola (Cinara kochiana kochiana)]